jgi:integrase
MAKGIYKLSNGKYRWHVMLQGVRYYGMASSSKEAEQARAQRLTEHHKGLVIAPNKVTFAEQLETWLQEKSKTCAVRTVSGYQYVARKYLSNALLGSKLNTLRPTQVKAVYEVLVARGLDQSTLRQTHVVVHGVLKSAVRDELIARNVAEGLKPHAKNKDQFKDLKVLTSEQAKQFAAACRQHNWGGIFLFMLLTGLRRGEALGLTWANVNLENKVPNVKIEQAVGNVNGRATITRPKTKSSRRSVYLCAKAARVLRERLELYVTRFGFEPKSNDFVFTNMSGGMIQPDHLKRHMDRICKQAEVPRVRIHDLRHTYASLSLKCGNRIEIVSKQLGHSSITMTLDVYRHVYVDEIAGATTGILDESER